MNNNARITKLPEIINQDTGLRELRMRRYDCLYLAGEQDPHDCANNEEIVTETITSQNETPKKETSGTTPTPKTQPVAQPTENLRINELTPWLQDKSRTVVNTTVMYNDSKEELIVITYLRMKDDSGVTKDFKYELKGDLKTFRREYRSTREKRYLNLVKKSSDSKEVVNGIVHCYDVPVCKDITLIVSFMNYNSEGESFIDSRPFMIDQRESEIIPENARPNSTVRTVEEPVVEDESDDEGGDGLHTQEYTLDEGEEPHSPVSIGPVLRADHIEGLCKGLIADTEACPKYLVDPTLERPNRKIPSAVVDMEEIGDAESANTQGTSIRIKKVEKPKQASGMTSSLRPRQRPAWLGVPQPVPGEALDFVDVVDEKIFPAEEVVLQPSIPREAEENSDLLPPANSNSKNYDWAAYQYFLDRLKQLKEAATGVAVDTAVDAYGNVVSKAEEIKIAEEKRAAELAALGKHRPRQRPEGLGKSSEETLAQPVAIEKDQHSDFEDIDAEEELATGMTSSLRPKQRPEGLGQQQAEAEDVASPAAIIPFVSIDGRFTYDLSLCGEHIVKAKTINYHQARGKYNSSGSLRNGAHYTSSVYDTVYHKPGNGSKQYGSEITKQVIEFAGCVLKQRYKDSLDNQVNNLSLIRGGRLGKQASHQNGLDVDVSYPHIAGKTSGFDNFAGNITNDRLIAAFDQARLLIYTDRVQMLFTDNRIRTKFCQYLKANNKLSTHREVVEKFMRQWAGHHNHYHVRVRCNAQNEGCVPDAEYARTNYCGQ